MASAAVKQQVLELGGAFMISREARAFGETTGVAGFHGSRAGEGILDGWLIDDSDADEAHAIEQLGIAVRTVPLWMSDPSKTRKLAEDALQLARELGRP